MHIPFIIISSVGTGCRFLQRAPELAIGIQLANYIAVPSTAKQSRGSSRTVHARVRTPVELVSHTNSRDLLATGTARALHNSGPSRTREVM